MQELVITKQIVQKLRSNDNTLIFAGYIEGCKTVRLFSDGKDYAIVCKVGSDVECCISGSNVSFADQVCALPCLKGQVKFCAVGDELFNHISARFGSEGVSRCGYYVYDGTPLTHVVTHKIEPIDPKFAQAVSDGTFYHADLEEIRRCLSLRPSACITENGKPVCWCLVHREGSLGMLFTLPEYRHKGLALDVMTALCQILIDRGQKPFAYIVDGNVASVSLAAKYNLKQIGHASYFSAKVQ